MRCHYLSDLHLESQSFPETLPKGDVLIIAGDLCHACCLDPERTDKYSIDQRSRVHRFLEAAKNNFDHVILVAGNHEPYDGVFEDTATCLRDHMPGVIVLDNETVEIGGIRFFGSTFWTDFDGGCRDALNAVRRRMGEYFFVRTRDGAADTTHIKFTPEHALKAHDIARSSLLHASISSAKPLIVITHHAPSYRSLNPTFMGNGLDAAYASKFDDTIATLDNVPIWIHGHTHVARIYRIGRTQVRTNALGFNRQRRAACRFSTSAFFDIDS